MQRKVECVERFFSNHGSFFMWNFMCIHYNNEQWLQM